MFCLRVILGIAVVAHNLAEAGRLPKVFQRAIGDLCETKEGRGDCRIINLCQGISYPDNLCPNDPEDVMCCVVLKCGPPGQETAGFCRSKGMNKCAHGSFYPGYCDGPDDIQCCIDQSIMIVDAALSSQTMLTSSTSKPQTTTPSPVTTITAETRSSTQRAWRASSESAAVSSSKISDASTVTSLEEETTQKTASNSASSPASSTPSPSARSNMSDGDRAQIIGTTVGSVLGLITIIIGWLSYRHMRKAGRQKSNEHGQSMSNLLPTATGTTSHAESSSQIGSLRQLGSRDSGQLNAATPVSPP